MNKFSLLFFLLLPFTVAAVPVSHGSAHYRIDVNVDQCVGFACNAGESAYFDLSFSNAVLFIREPESGDSIANTWGISNLSLRLVTLNGEEYSFPYSIQFEAGQSYPYRDLIEQTDYQALRILNDLNFPYSNEPVDRFILWLFHRQFGLSHGNFELSFSGDSSFLSGFAVAGDWTEIDLTRLDFPAFTRHWLIPINTLLHI